MLPIGYSSVRAFETSSATYASPTTRLAHLLVRNLKRFPESNLNLNSRLRYTCTRTCTFEQVALAGNSQPRALGMFNSPFGFKNQNHCCPFPCADPDLYVTHCSSRLFRILMQCSPLSGYSRAVHMQGSLRNSCFTIDTTDAEIFHHGPG
jgi:hypothetical protein